MNPLVGISSYEAEQDRSRESEEPEAPNERETEGESEVGHKPRTMDTAANKSGLA